MASIGRRLRHAWNAFANEDRKTKDSAAALVEPFYGAAHHSAQRPDKPRPMYANDKSIISSIYMRLAMDVASVPIRHVNVDDKKRYLSDRPSYLNDCLTVEANIDQAATHFRQDMAISLFDEAAIAIVPVDTTVDIEGGFDVKTLRVGKIIAWYPKHVKVSVWRDEYGRREDITLPKRSVAIVENPLSPVMNAPNSILQRLIRKLAQIDQIDDVASSGKLDMIIQLPYTVHSEMKKATAETRVKDIEFQLSTSAYGIGYIDANEKVTQLNRPVENNLIKHVDYLTGLLFAMLGLTPEIMNGTAEETAMLNYYNRTVGPIVTAITEAMHRSFLTKTARTQGQAIMFFRDPFKLVPLADIAEIADKFTRNEIFSSNEIRQFMGIPPAQDPKADQLRNSNMPQSELGVDAPSGGGSSPLDEISSEVDRIFQDLGVPNDIGTS